MRNTMEPVMFETMDAAIEYIFQTRRRLDAAPRGLDEDTRDPASTRNLLTRAGLLKARREYVVVTGSRGKGSVVGMMATLLRALGRRAGMVTSPHLVHWNERIRVNGRMIPDQDFLRILGMLRPHIDAVTATLDADQYLSPQGIFLAIALQYFDECSVDVAVLEVGRGGRYDDIAVVPNRLSVFAPIMLEHTSLLGSTLERIAWHKAGVMSAGGVALSLPQAPEVMRALRQEADRRRVDLRFLTEPEIARWRDDRPSGQLIQLAGCGELLLPLLGRYQIENASLAIRALELLTGLSASGRPIDGDFIRAIREGLAKVKWLGRLQQLEENPAIFVDGAITIPSAESFVESVQARLRQPVIAIVGVPRDRDYAGVYRVMARVSQTLIITETDINPNTRFPDPDAALEAARQVASDVHATRTLPEALELARARAGESGSILLAVSLMLVGECMLIWDIDTTTI